MPQNNATQKTPSSHSTFPLAYHLMSTERFGEISCPFITEVVPDDKIRLHCPTNVQTTSLKSPLLSNLTKKRDYFSVPLQALLPKNWELIYTQPNIGDDVPDDANTVVKGFPQKAIAYFRRFVEIPSAASVVDQLTSLFRALVVGEYFFSAGSLLHQVGYKLTKAISFLVPSGQKLSFDKFFDYVCSEIVQIFGQSGSVLEVAFEDTSYSVVFSESSDYSIYYGSGVISFRRFLELLRDEPTGHVMSVVADEQSLDDLVRWFSESIYQTNDYGDTPLNYGRLAAYQITCHHFYSNDHVDYIYSAELYRQLLGSYLALSTDFQTFSYNGLDMQYDNLSGFYLNSLLTDSEYEPNFTLPYIAAIFSWRHSLRFTDYFTGAKTRPLAVGDVNVDVNSDKVNVIDFAQKSQFARFLNAVNRSGRKIANYISNLFPGAKPAYDYHNPLYLGHTNDEIRTSETENTGADQLTQAQTVTSRMYASSDQFGFEFTADRPGYVLCLSYYDIPRVYSQTIDRNMFHINRADMFNPFMQFVGDQRIYLPELHPAAFADTFAYTLRHMEYKQKFSQATGGFVENLPSWIFLADNVDGLENRDTLGPAYIRSSNLELDEFFLAGLTGYSLGSYFHFIVSNNNDCTAERPMVYAPSIM